MRPTILLFTLCLPFLGICQESIPKDSGELLKKLEAYSAELRSETEAKIVQKENEVIDVLQKHLTRETKSGNLQSALALKNMIDTLKKGPAEKEVLSLDSEAPSSNLERLPRSVREFIESKWGLSGGNKYSFEDDGTGESDIGGDFTWIFEEPDLIRVTHDDSGNTATFKIGKRIEDSELLEARGQKISGKTVSSPK